MKSYINSLADYRQAEFEREVTISCPEEYIETQMKHLSRAFKKTEAVTVLEKGDVTVLSLESELSKFNRSTVFVTVGGGLFDKAFEEQLIGHNIGETFEVSVDRKPVKVTVKQATRTSFPAPTDEMALAYAKDHDDFKEIKTVDEYRKQVVETYIGEKKRDAIYGALDQILDYVLTHSDWEFDETEVAEMIAEGKKYINEELEAEGKTLELFTKEELSNFFGINDLSEFEDMLRSECERQIATSLFMAANNGIDAKTASEDEINECSWEFLENYVKDNIKIKEEK